MELSPQQKLELSNLSDTPIYDVYIAARKSALLAVAVHIGFFDKLAIKEAMTLQEVMKEFDLTERGADGFLVGLRSVQLLDLRTRKEGQYAGQGEYFLTDMARLYLVREATCYLGGLVELEWDDFITPQALFKAMKTGSIQAYGGGDVWAAHEENAEKTRKFTKAMHSISIRPALALSEKFAPFASGKHKCLLDVGGGSGIYAIAALLRHTALRAVVFDIPAVCPVTLEFIKQYHVEDRCMSHGGDMFKEEYPRKVIFGQREEQVDMVFYSQILHDWPRNKGKDLLRKAYETLPEGGLVLVNEKLLTDERDGPVANAMVSLDMLFWTEGQQYSAKELFTMMVDVGFKDPQAMLTIGYWSIVWATK